MKVKLWSIQKIEFLEFLQKEKIVYGSKEFVDFDFLDGYHWLMNKMDEKIGNRPFSECYPIWGWYQWNNSKYKKPNLLAKTHGEKGTRCVRLEIEKNSDEILLSDFMLWHFPLCYKSYIGYKYNSDNFEKELESKKLQNENFNSLPVNIREKIIKSWDLIMDMEFNEPYFTTKRENKSIQATFWSLNLDEIKKIEYFIAK